MTVASPPIPIWTAGYADFTPQTLIDAIKTREINQVLDIRWSGYSLKDDWRVMVLHRLFTHHHIRYFHIRELGIPPWQRESPISRNLSAYAASLKANSRVPIVADYIDGRTLLLCACSNPATCHRTTLAAELQLHIPWDTEITSINPRPTPSTSSPSSPASPSSGASSSMRHSP